MQLKYKNWNRYDHQKLSEVWHKGIAIAGIDPNVARRDACGARIHWADHGNRDSHYGWEVDHVMPEAHGGGDQLHNLQPLHWQNNLAKADGPLRCAVRQ